MQLTPRFVGMLVTSSVAYLLCYIVLNFSTYDGSMPRMFRRWR